MYINNKSLGRFFSTIDYFNRMPNEKKFNNLDNFISSVNSTLGMMKSRNEYKNIIKCIGMISENWFDFVHFNKDKVTVEPNEGFTYKERLIKKYNLKIKNHGSKKLQNKTEAA